MGVYNYGSNSWDIFDSYEHEFGSYGDYVTELYFGEEYVFLYDKPHWSGSGVNLVYMTNVEVQLIHEANQCWDINPSNTIACGEIYNIVDMSLVKGIEAGAYTNNDWE